MGREISFLAPFFYGKNFKKYLFLLIVFSIILFSNSAIADADAGKKVFNKCKSCHVLKEEQNRLGPHLVKIFGENQVA